MEEAGVHMRALEDVIRNKYIPALFGRMVSDSERNMPALPAAHGGAEIDNPSKDSLYKDNASMNITAALGKLIIDQQIGAEPPDTNEVKRVMLNERHHRHKLNKSCKHSPRTKLKLSHWRNTKGHLRSSRPSQWSAMGFT